MGVLIRGFLVVLLVAGLTAATVGLFSGMPSGDILAGGVPFLGPSTPVQGDQPGVTAPNSSAPPPDNYVRVTLVFDCRAEWCQLPEGQTMTMRLQQVNRSEFEWTGLYASGIRDGATVQVDLFVGRLYRILVRHPDGRIFHIANWKATNSQRVRIALTEEQAE